MSYRQELPAGTRLDGAYVIERVLAAGGFGITYSAQDVRLRKRVAIKEYFPSELAVRHATVSVSPKSESVAELFEWGRRRFVEEAQTLARFRHPSIVGVSRIFSANNSAYMVLEFIEGPSFKAWLARTDAPPTQEQLDAIVRPLLDALETVHVAGVLHRDIAPDNILMQDGRTPVLIDFGAARSAIGARSRTVAAIVKPGYSPKEQYTIEVDAQGPWTDIYALAATLYQAVTGGAPVDAQARDLGSHLAPAVSAARPEYRREFLAAIDAAMALRPSERPQSIAAWRPLLFAEPPARTVAAMATSATTEAMSLADAGVATARPPIRRSRKRGRILALAALGASLLGSGAYVLLDAMTEMRLRIDAERLSKAQTERIAAEIIARQQAEAETKRIGGEIAASRARSEAEARKAAEDIAAARQAEQEARRLATQAEAKRAEAEAEARRQREEQQRRQAEAERQQRDAEARVKAAEAEARRRADEIETRRKGEEEARRAVADAEAKLKAEVDRRRKLETDDTKRKTDAEAEARRRSEEAKAGSEARRKADEDAKRKTETEARQRAEADARRRSEEDRRRKAEADARTKADEEAKQKADADSRRKAEETTKRFAEARKLYLEKSYVRAAELLEPLARAGHVDAMAHYGNLFLHGWGVDRDDAKAKEWFEKAAAAGHVWANTGLGVVFERGRAVPRDYAKARELYEKAAALGDATAVSNLGWLFYNGRGVPQDFPKAREHFERAAANVASAMNGLGSLYRHGYGVQKDLAKAREWLEKADAAGDRYATGNLGQLYAEGLGVPKDLARARRLFTSSAESGNGHGMNLLGNAHENGWGGPVDLPKAREWYEKSANAGWSWGIHNLARMLDRGKGGAPEYARAARLLLDALRAGNEGAQRNFAGKFRNWHPSTVMELKRELTRLGHYKGPINATWEPAARQAAETFAR